MMYLRRGLLGVAVLVLSLGLYSQTRTVPMGIITYADGDEVVIVRSNTPSTYYVSDGTLIGMTLRQGDQISTGADTIIEIQLAPGTSILSVAENTTFKLSAIGANNSATVDLVYGRLRSQVDKLTTGSSFNVRSRTAVAGVRGTNFGFDVIAPLNAGQVPTSNVYCFEGAVDLYPLSPAEATDAALAKPFVPAADAKPVPVTAGTSVRVVDPRSSEAKSANAQLNADGSRAVIQSSTIDQQTRDYWEKDRKNPPSLDNDGIQKFYDALSKISPSLAQANESSSGQDVSLSADSIRKIAAAVKALLEEEKTQSSQTATPSTETQAASSSQATTNTSSSTSSAQDSQTQSSTNTSASTATASATTRNKSLADTIAPFETKSLKELLVQEQYVYGPDTLKTLGLTLFSVGLAADLTGMGLRHLGVSNFGMDSASADTSSVITLVSGGALTISGLVLYFIGLFD